MNLTNQFESITITIPSSPNGVFGVDWKVCVGCAQIFYKKDVDSQVEFKRYKRCPLCRNRTDIRGKKRIYNSPGYVSKFSLDPEYRLLYAMGTLFREDLLNYKEEQELTDKLLNSTISKIETIKLRNHFSYVIFFAHFQIRLPNLPYQSINDIPKEVLRLLFYKR